LVEGSDVGVLIEFPSAKKEKMGEKGELNNRRGHVGGQRKGVRRGLCESGAAESKGMQ